MSSQTPDGDLERTLARLTSQRQAAERRPAEVASWRRQVESLVGRGSSPRRQVDATVNIQGVLTGLTVADSLAQQGGRAVADQVLRAVADAQQAVRDQAEAMSSQMWGPDSPTTQAFRAEVAANTTDPDIEDGPDLTGGSRATTPQGGTW
ncbi:MAG: YbaB/EbfC family nucleoid-associated protein [Micrococcales bacterium]|nr:YbaB/EbfC family nucleoid-associated protein [Micrococcales bacterium]